MPGNQPTVEQMIGVKGDLEYMADKFVVNRMRGKVQAVTRPIRQKDSEWFAGNKLSVNAEFIDS